MLKSRLIRFSTLILIASIVQAASPARADLVYTTVAGSDGDGALSGSLSFVALNGAIEVIVTNNETGTIGKGQAISAFSFTIAGLSTPTSFTSLSGLSYNPSSGTSWTTSNGTAFSDTPQVSTPAAIDHWGFSPSGSTVSLATAKSSVSGATGNPHYMILASSGKAGNGNSLSNGNFDPFVIGPATFVLADAGVTAGQYLTKDNFTNVSISFGTNLDQTLAANGSGTSGSPPAPPPPAAAPEPSTLVLAISALPVGLVLLARKRRQARTA